MEMLFNLCLEIVLSIIAIVASKYLIPWLKEKRLFAAAQIAVEAAEQIFTETGAGKKKMEQALSWISAQFKIDEDEAKKLIEAAVYKMKNKS